MLLVLLVGGFLAYKTRGHSKNSKFEGVRAYIYLDALLRGYSPQGANSVVHHRLTTAYPESVRSACDAIKNLHEGRHLNMVGYAYRRGMQPLMPRWYYNLISNKPLTPSLKSVYEVQEGSDKNNDEDTNKYDNGHGPFTDGMIDNILQDAGHPLNKELNDLRNKYVDERMEEYDRYCDTFVTEVERLTGKPWADAPGLKSAKNGPLQRGFLNGDDPLALAENFYGYYLERKRSKEGTDK